MVLDRVALLFGDVAFGDKGVLDLGGELMDHGDGLIERDELGETDGLCEWIVGQGAVAAEDGVWDHDAMELVYDLLDGAGGSAGGDHDLDRC